MADKEFILQGFTARTHADAVREIFDIPNIQKVIVSVAFVSESGVKQLEAQLAPHSAYATVFAGVRNDITSHQGLVALLALASNLYVVDTGSRSILFHPKLYFTKGDTRARLVIGSANLTLGGLNNNIEAGMLIDFDLTNAADKAGVEKIEAEFDKLSGDFGANVLKIAAVPDLDAMLTSGRLIDEMAAAPPRPSTAASSAGGGGDVIPRIKLKVVPLRRALKKAKAAAKPKAPKAAKAAAGVAPALVPQPIPKAAGVQFELVWESKPLSLRDLNIPDGENTNKTGSMSLDKGMLPPDVDHRHYFREDIFNQLAWSPTNRKTTEEAHAKFHLVIKGISFGEFDLRIGHTIGTDSAAYKQNNAMTRLSWGPVKSYVGQADLKDRTLSLFRDAADPTRFVLEID